jgi:hypothetical protein
MLSVSNAIVSGFCTGANSAVQLPGQEVSTCSAVDFLLHPSAALVLSSCLLFGCCVASFFYRRRTMDPWQGLVFVVFIAWAAAVGYGVGASANLIVLGFLPWATCAAMLVSMLVQSLTRSVRSRRSARKIQMEKDISWIEHGERI